MFYVWEGYHRLTAWWRHINNHHPLDKDWHISAECIVVDPRNCIALFLNAELDILCSCSSVLVLLSYSSNIFFD